MTGRFGRFCVDACVCVKVFFDEELADSAADLLAPIETDAEVYVPELLFTEFANVCWKRTQRSECTARQARQRLREVSALDFRVIPSKALTDDALNIALQREISVYDGCYVAAARLVDAPLITADKRLVRKMDGARPRVLWLGDVDCAPR